MAAGEGSLVDTTVVETNIHYPTDSGLLGDGVRVLTRAMKKVGSIAADVGAKLRDRSRSVKLRVLEIARAARSKVPQSQENSSRLMANCWMPLVGWWDKPSDSPWRLRKV